jgi:hypothetical protein
METMSLSLSDLALFGGVQVVLTGLVTWLGKVWLNRIHERDKKLVLEHVETLKAGLAATNQRLQAVLDKGLHVHRVQFDTEFEAYRDVWDSVIEVSNAALKLRPAMDCLPENREAERRHRLQEFDDANRAFAQKVYKMRPFYDESVFGELFEFLKLLRSEAADYATEEGSGDPEYWRRALKNAGEIPAHMNALCARIRSRIREMNPVD